MLELQYELQSKAAKLFATTDIANAFPYLWQDPICFPLKEYLVHLESSASEVEKWCYQFYGVIQTALEQGEALKLLQYIDNIIMWGHIAAEGFEKGKKIVQIIP